MSAPTRRAVELAVLARARRRGSGRFRRHPRSRSPCAAGRAPSRTARCSRAARSRTAGRRARPAGGRSPPAAPKPPRSSRSSATIAPPTPVPIVSIVMSLHAAPGAEAVLRPAGGVGVVVDGDVDAERALAASARKGSLRQLMFGRVVDGRLRGVDEAGGRDTGRDDVLAGATAARSASTTGRRSRSGRPPESGADPAGGSRRTRRRGLRRSSFRRCRFRWHARGFRVAER